VANKAALIILDGIGISPENEGNAVHLARTPYLDELIKSYPKCLLNASGQEVGLPWGEFGNSEVGHTNIGLGRVVLQDLPQINKALDAKTILQKENFKEAIEKLKGGSNKLHLIGMASDGAVHGHIGHLTKLIAIIKEQVPAVEVRVHLIADGRDVAEKSIEKFYELTSKMEAKGAKMSSVSGRYFAMDRDKNYERIQLAVDAILGKGKENAGSLKEAINKAYRRKETDEYISPTTIGAFNVDIQNDVFIFTNYRADRAIELTRAFVEDNTNEITKDGPIRNFYMMTTYDDNLSAKSIFSNLDLNDSKENPLTNSSTEIISKSGLSQLHVAETEKFAHVTYFFAGGIKEELENQTNKIIPSEKVKSYDLFPQMKAKEITDEIISAAGKFDFIVANLANGDMVGHSGKLDASIKAVEIIDAQLARSIPELLKNNYKVFVTADHGNCDEMIDSLTKKVNKEHSFNPVPFIYATKESRGGYISMEELRTTASIGVLADIVPTVLLEMDLELTPEMMGINLKDSLV